MTDGFGRVSIWSEPFRPTGGIAAPGVRNALGRPGIELSALLLRETVQNTWDARDPRRKGPIKYSARHQTISGHELVRLRTFFHELPGANLGLGSLLQRKKVAILTVLDRGTIGLAGPTRADLVSPGAQNFVNFVRNVGHAQEKKLSGGTYGYGKSVLYRASSAGTILVHSRCRSGKDIVSRLIGAALGQPFESRGRRFTGRHWWGVPDDQVGIEPVTGRRAELIAAQLGMPGFEDDELGTTIMIVGASIGDTAQEAMREMAEAVAWHCWPKIVDLSGKGPEMVFDIHNENDQLKITDPEEHPELKHFVVALRDVLARRAKAKKNNPFVFDIESFRPKQLLGHLSLRIYSTPATLPDTTGRPFDPPSRHVALLRHPKLVVSYKEGPELPLEFSWAGVFLVWDEVDEAFAQAEPPSHDSWSYVDSPHHKRSFVRIALHRIQEFVSQLAVMPEPVGGSTQPLGRLADKLGELLVYGTGTGVSILRSKRKESGRVGRGVRGTGRPSLEIGDPELVRYRGRAALRVPFTIRLAAGSPAALVEAIPGVAVNDGTGVERDPPEGAETPRILEWTVGNRASPSASLLRVTGVGLHSCSVLVTVPTDVAVAVDLNVRTEA